MERLPLQERQRSRQKNRKKKNSQSNSSSEEQGDEDNGVDLSQVEDGRNREQKLTEQYAGNIRSSLMKFFQDVGQKNGMVFNGPQRKKMIKQQIKQSKKSGEGQSQKMIEWSESHKWNEEIQQAKIQSVFARYKDRFVDKQQKILRVVFQKISYMFCDQATQQLYNLLMEISLRIREKNRIQTLMREVARNESKTYMFFSFNFSKYHKVKNPEKLSGFLKVLGLNIAQNLDRLIKAIRDQN